MAQRPSLPLPRSAISHRRSQLLLHQDTADSVPKHPVRSAAADESGVFVTFTGPAVGDNEAGRSPWEGKADCRSWGLCVPSSGAMLILDSLAHSLMCPLSLNCPGEAAPWDHHAWVQLCLTYWARWDLALELLPCTPQMVLSLLISENTLDYPVGPMSSLAPKSGRRQKSVSERPGRRGTETIFAAFEEGARRI